MAVSEDDVRHFTAALEDVRSKMELLAEGHSTLATKIDAQGAKLDRVDERTGVMNLQLGKMETDMGVLRSKVVKLEKDMHVVKDHLGFEDFYAPAVSIVRDVVLDRLCRLSYRKGRL